MLLNAAQRATHGGATPLHTHQAQQEQQSGAPHIRAQAGRCYAGNATAAARSDTLLALDVRHLLHSIAGLTCGCSRTRLGVPGVGNGAVNR